MNYYLGQCITDGHFAFQLNIKPFTISETELF